MNSVKIGFEKGSGTFNSLVLGDTLSLEETRRKMNRSHILMMQQRKSFLINLCCFAARRLEKVLTLLIMKTFYKHSYYIPGATIV